MNNLDITTAATSPTAEKGGYYKLPTGAECIELVEDISDRETIPGRVRMAAGNAAEYIWRCGKKPGIDWREDFFKAANELFRQITGEWLNESQKKKFFERFPQKWNLDEIMNREG